MDNIKDHRCALKSHFRFHLLYLVYTICIVLATASPDTKKTANNDAPIEDVEAYLDISFFDHRNHSAVTTRLIGMFGVKSRRIAVEGEVIHVRSRYGEHDGCDYVDDWNIPTKGPWIALAMRGECSFEQKITNLHKNYNASAVIIYNTVKEPLFIINHSEMPVVTALISKKDGELMGDLFDHGVVVKMLITSENIIAHKKAADQASLQMRSAHEFRRSRAVMAASILVLLGVGIGFLVLLINTIRTVMASSSRHKVKKFSAQQKDANKKTWPILSEA